MATAIRVAVAFAYLSSGAHFVLVDHAPCVEHGDVAHVAPTDGHGHGHSQGRAARAAAPGPSDADHPTVRPAPTHASAHGHCDTTAARMASATPVATWAAPPDAVADDRPSEWPSIEPPESRSVLRYAPKRAPPLSVG